MSSGQKHTTESPVLGSNMSAQGISTDRPSRNEPGRGPKCSSCPLYVSGSSLDQSSRDKPLCAFCRNDKAQPAARPAPAQPAPVQPTAARPAPAQQDVQGALCMSCEKVHVAEAPNGIPICDSCKVAESISRSKMRDEHARKSSTGNRCKVCSKVCNEVQVHKLANGDDISICSTCDAKCHCVVCNDFCKLADGYEIPVCLKCAAKHHQEVTRITGTSLLQRVNEIWKKPTRVCATCSIRETDDPLGVCGVS